MVDSQIVVRDGKTLNVDEHAAARALQEAGERMWPRMSQGDWANRTAGQLSPRASHGGRSPISRPHARAAVWTGRQTT
jgi:hypothetical protein